MTELQLPPLDGSEHCSWGPTRVANAQQSPSSCILCRRFRVSSNILFRMLGSVAPTSRVRHDFYPISARAGDRFWIIFNIALFRWLIRLAVQCSWHCLMVPFFARGMTSVCVHSRFPIQGIKGILYQAFISIKGLIKQQTATVTVLE